MKELFFSGKRKFITIPAALVFGLAFLPFVIGGSLVWLVYRKIDNKKLQYVAYCFIGLLTLFIGSAMFAGIALPSKTTSARSTVVMGTSVSEVPTTIPTEQPTPTISQANKQDATIVRVVDGDTIIASINNKNETIRIIGINTPETVDPRKTVECFGAKASKLAKDTLTNKSVLLEADPTQADRDKYNRLLRYVWTDDGAMDFGKMMISTGFAYEYTYDIPYKYQNTYKQAQQEAQTSKKGLWADNACPNTSTTIPSQPIQQTTQQSTVNTSGSTGTSYSGGDKDCKDFSTQAEAQAYFDSKGGSASNNVDKLDGDHDGIVCESLP